MDEKQRRNKRIIIVMVCVLILVLIIGLFFLWQKPKATCLDGIQNQNEEDVDCGGICKACQKFQAEDLIATDPIFVDSGTQGKVDLLGKVKNPNGNLGSGNFEYQFDLLDSAGQIIASRQGKSFILPGDEKYIVETGVAVDQEPVLAELKITSANWTEFNSFYEKPQFTITNKRYDENGDGVNFAEATGILRNDSPFDFNIIKIKVILRDGSDKVLAVNSTEMRTVKSGEEREYKVFWPNEFQGNVNKMEVESEVNVFDSQPFLERYYTPQKYQQSF